MYSGERGAAAIEFGWPFLPKGEGLINCYSILNGGILKSGRSPRGVVRPNKALQADKDKLSRLLHSQEPRQLAVAAELFR